MNIKKSLLVGAAVATIGVGSLSAVGAVSADTNTSASSSNSASTTDKSSSLIDKIAAKFNLKTADVKAVFDEDRTARQAEMKANRAERLAQAVTDGKITQAQADYITKAQAEIEALRGTTSPEDETNATRTEIKTKMDALRDWAETNNVDMMYIMGGHGGPGMSGMHGGPRGDSQGSDTTTTN